MRFKRAKRRIVRLVLIAVSAAAFLAIGVFAHFLPFETLLPAYALPARGEGELRLHFLDVGEADCAVIEFPGGDVFVVDAGDGSRKTEQKLVRYLKGLDFSRLTFVATHGDGDHTGGFPKLLKTFGAERMLLSRAGGDGGYEKVLEAAEEAGVPVESVRRYDAFADGSGAYLACVSPRSEEETDDNDGSAVLYLSYLGVDALLCADISAARERLLLSEYALGGNVLGGGEYAVTLADVEILKVSHHGASDASCAEFLALARPAAAIVSCGKGNRYGHPAQETVERFAREGSALYRTDECGDIMITISDGAFTVRTENNI